MTGYEILAIISMLNRRCLIYQLRIFGFYSKLRSRMDFQKGFRQSTYPGRRPPALELASQADMLEVKRAIAFAVRQPWFYAIICSGAIFIVYEHLLFSIK